MKKVILTVLVIAVCLAGCNRTPSGTVEPPFSENEEVKQELPLSFSLDKLDLTVEEMFETTELNFTDGDTIVRLTNNDGKYFVVNYVIKNNGSFDIDIDHSAEVFVTDVTGKVHYGEYYECKTGKENIEIKPGEEKTVSFVTDLEIKEKPDIITFKYKGKSYEIKAEVE